MFTKIKETADKLTGPFKRVATAAATAVGLMGAVAPVQAAEPQDLLASAGFVTKPTVVSNLVVSINTSNGLVVQKNPSPETLNIHGPFVNSIGNYFPLISDKYNLYGENYLVNSPSLVDSINTNNYFSGVVGNTGASYDSAAYANTGNTFQLFSASTSGLGQANAYSGFQYYNPNDPDDPANWIIRSNQYVWKIEVPTVLSGDTSISGSVNFTADVACAKGCTSGGAMFLNYITEDGMDQGDAVSFRRVYSAPGSYSDSADFSFDISPFAGQTLYFSLAAGASSAIYSSAVLGSNNTISRDYNLISAAVPEPEKYALLAAGLAVVGGAVVRRRNTATRFPAFGSGFMPSNAA